ncbi:MAG: NAD(P)H-dependent oxidoreductase [Bacteroidetes bacterium 47-18]|nr:MAG: NAD(P)H-dependent oxidoreductase [Bacteroidetes bacterium 47-18]
MEIIEALQWRYATKKMNGMPVAADKVATILEAARLAPTSSGLQPFRVIVVTDPELKAKIQPIAYGQSQITDASHLLIFAAWDKYTDERIDSAFELMNAKRGLPSDTTDEYKNGLKAHFATLTEEQQAAHAAKQSYIAFSAAIVAAAMQEVDSTPMEGFDNAALDKLLELDKAGLRSATILALGYRDAANDWLVNLEKVRTAKEDFIIER